MAAATFDLTGDNRIMQGASYSYGVTFYDVSVTPRVPIDLTGATLRSQIRRKHLAPVLAEFSVTVTDAVHGKATLSLTPDQTAALPGTRPDAFFEHDVLLIRADGSRLIPIQGQVEVDDQITE